MTDQTVVPPPLPPAVKKPARFKKTRIVLFTIAILWIGSRLFSHLDLSALGSPDLKVQIADEILNGDNLELQITNAWDKPVTITGIAINNRQDCQVFGMAALNGDKTPLFPRTLKVGDELIVLSSCKVIRAEIQTDKGSDTYSFN
jgi:hypothetical protein